MAHHIKVLMHHGASHTRRASRVRRRRWRSRLGLRVGSREARAEFIPASKYCQGRRTLLVCLNTRRRVRHHNEVGPPTLEDDDEGEEMSDAERRERRRAKMSRDIVLAIRSLEVGAEHRAFASQRRSAPHNDDYRVSTSLALLVRRHARDIIARGRAEGNARSHQGGSSPPDLRARGDP